MKSSNPVEAHRREQRKKEVAKLKKDRDTRKQALADHQLHLAASRSKLAELDELAHSRPLTPAEKAQRKELRSLLATPDASTGKRSMGGGAGLRAHDADAVDEFGRSLSARGQGFGGNRGAVFDPLAESHASLLANSSARTMVATAAPIPLTTYASSSDDDDNESDPDLLDFDPPFPPLDEPKPPSYRVPLGEPIVKTMQGYPPPPMGPIPRHKPQMDPPGTGASTTATPAVPTKEAIAGLPPKPSVGVSGFSKEGADAARKGSDVGAAAQVVISAAPVIRDRKAEKMRLAPESVRKRMEEQQQQQQHPHGDGAGDVQATAGDHVGAADADAAYQAFMKEMEGLL